MTTQTIRVTVPVFDIQIDYQGQSLVLSFKEMKRNERIKLQIDLAKALELHSKTDRTPEEEAFYKKISQQIDCTPIEALAEIRGVSGEVVIGGTVLSLETVKDNEFPESLYAAIKLAHEDHEQKLRNLKAEASAKNDAPPIDSAPDLSKS